jgi:hypothetical protein
MATTLARTARGGVAGLVGSAVMGGLFLAARTLGVVSKLAPEHITEAGMNEAGIDADEGTDDVASVVAHLAFGAANGAVFGVVERWLPGPPVTRGLTYASGLLLASYEGWVPAAGILPPLRDQTPGGRWTLITGHAVYGAILGQLAGASR